MDSATKEAGDMGTIFPPYMEKPYSLFCSLSCVKEHGNQCYGCPSEEVSIRVNGKDTSITDKSIICFNSKGCRNDKDLSGTSEERNSKTSFLKFDYTVLLLFILLFSLIHYHHTTTSSSSSSSSSSTIIKFHHKLSTNETEFQKERSSQTGLSSYLPMMNRTNWDNSTIYSCYVGNQSNGNDGKILYDWLRNATYILQWDRNECVATFPSIANDTIHIRRNDFQHFMKQHNDKYLNQYNIIYNNNTSKMINDNTTIYISTDAKSTKFFNIKHQHYNVLFLKNYSHIIQKQYHNNNIIQLNFYDIIEELIASKSNTFIGTYYSTFTGYINRIRGYHSTISKQHNHEDGSINSYYIASDLNKVRRRITKDAAMNAKTVLGYNVSKSFDEMNDREANISTWWSTFAKEESPQLSIISTLFIKEYALRRDNNNSSNTEDTQTKNKAPRPRYAHFSLIFGEDKRKLFKRLGAHKRLAVQRIESKHVIDRENNQVQNLQLELQKKQDIIQDLEAKVFEDIYLFKELNQSYHELVKSRSYMEAELSTILKDYDICKKLLEEKSLQIDQQTKNILLLEEKLHDRDLQENDYILCIAVTYVIGCHVIVFVALFWFVFSQHDAERKTEHNNFPREITEEVRQIGINSLEQDEEADFGLTDELLGVVNYHEPPSDEKVAEEVPDLKERDEEVDFGLTDELLGVVDYHEPRSDEKVEEEVPDLKERDEEVDFGLTDELLGVVDYHEPPSDEKVEEEVPDRKRGGEEDANSAMHSNLAEKDDEVKVLTINYASELDKLNEKLSSFQLERDDFVLKSSNKILELEKKIEELTQTDNAMRSDLDEIKENASTKKLIDLNEHNEDHYSNDDGIVVVADHEPPSDEKGEEEVPALEGGEEKEVEIMWKDKLIRIRHKMLDGKLVKQREQKTKNKWNRACKADECFNWGKKKNDHYCKDPKCIKKRASFAVINN